MKLTILLIVLSLASVVKACFHHAVGVAHRSIIGDHQMTASSLSGINGAPYYGRLNMNRMGWRASTSNSLFDWLQIDFGRTVKVCAVETQGDFVGVPNAWVIDFYLSFSSDGASWSNSTYENGIQVIYTRQGGANYIDQKTLPVTVFARYIRFHPISQYYWNALKVEVYEDIDDCLTNASNCDQHATCVDTVGSFSCLCNHGFSGNGTSCSDIDECFRNAHNCDENATCTNTQGSFYCSCNQGFRGNGTSCSDVEKCPAQVIQGIAWAATAAAGIDIQPCPNGASGNASRECSNDAKWKDTSFLGCSSFGFISLKDQIEAATNVFQSNTSVGEALAQLVNQTNPITKNVTRPTEIYGGDLLIAVDILVLLAEYNNASQGSISSEEHVKDFSQVVSNLLEPENAVTWLGLEQEGQGRGRALVNAVDDYGLGVAATLNESTKTRTVATKNLKLTIKRITPESPVKNEGLSVSYEHNSIRLPSEAFHSSVSRFVSVIYLTLNNVFALAKTKSEDIATVPKSTVVSATVLPDPPEKFNEPVKIVLQNKWVSDPSGASPNATCVFWRKGEDAVWKTSGCELVPSESDAKMTTCKCDHLTIFASLMDPFNSTIGEPHKKALEMISIIGCTISLIAVLVTIAVSLVFWRAVKSPRAKVLLNLCVAVALSCIFVILEGLARGNKVGCTVVAAFLHYFLLSLFSWMLCEGVLLYILLVKVFGGIAEEKVKYFYIFGWGFPAIIVAISLAATQAVGYGNAHACRLDVSSGLIWGFIAPAITVILVNIVVFMLVIRQMMGTRHVQNKTQIEKVKAGVKASAVILPLLGITWLFGLLSFNSATIAFKYIFAIANSLQGLMIFIFHCLLNKQIKDAIKRMREKSSSAVVSSNPKNKAFPKSQAKLAVKQQKVPKKRSNRAQNDYEMMDHARLNPDPNLPDTPCETEGELSDEAYNISK
ncbi:adhesion G protein-coupled receptor L4-like isoform X2 [Montipora foliosa]|uniref:adhesion G protein-coupled receptor L4-like isoform X2 n=1 Tax=Montipora foliosa TaxID=591990 RepID=UPI0035F180F1